MTILCKLRLLYRLWQGLKQQQPGRESVPISPEPTFLSESKLQEGLTSSLDSLTGEARYRWLILKLDRMETELEMMRPAYMGDPQLARKVMDIGRTQYQLREQIAGISRATGMSVPWPLDDPTIGGE